jgi:hypothetical protein
MSWTLRRFRIGTAWVVAVAWTLFSVAYAAILSVPPRYVTPTLIVS